jgi:integrase
MARRRNYRIHGPYKHRRKWRVVVIAPDGTQHVESFDSEAEAKAKVLKEKLRKPGMTSVGQAVEKYCQYMKERGNTDGHIATTAFRLRGWFPEFLPLRSIKRNVVECSYRDRTKKVSAATHRNELGQVKTFFRFCVRNRMLKASPAEDVEPVGKPSRGKPQLNRKQAKRFFLVAHEMAASGDTGAVAALMALELGMRSLEIRTRRALDVIDDEDGVFLWIKRGKTPAASRVFKVEGDLAGYLVSLADGLEPKEYLFKNRTRHKRDAHRCSNWLIDAVRGICEVAGVPYIPPHGLRGTKGTLEAEEDAPVSTIARQLGHSNPEVTRRHYIRGGADQGSRKVLRVLKGGRK